ncbi:MAG TPA: response regulator, partial [Aggregatilineales bacterium]|nr:response regulator [Aggregatilineales bacterium]
MANISKRQDNIARPGASSNGTDQSGGLILIADDDVAQRSLLRRLLETKGYSVIEASDGAQAVSQYMQDHPSVVLLDAKMPKLDGFAACQQIRALPDGYHPAIILVTVLDDEESVKRAFEVGATDFITKPIHWPVFFNRMRRFVQVAEQAAKLEEEHNLLRTIIDVLPDYFFVKDTSGRFILSNLAHAQAAGCSSPDQLIGKSADEVFPGRLASQFDADDQRVMATGQALINVERRTVDPDDHTRLRDVLTTKVPLRDRYGNITGLIGISRDISERKQTEDALKTAHAELEKRVEERTAQLSAANTTLQAEVQARRLAEQQQLILSSGLSAVASSASEFVSCPDVDAMFRKAVEFAETKLGMAHCGILSSTEQELRGTYATDGEG